MQEPIANTPSSTSRWRKTFCAPPEAVNSIRSNETHAESESDNFGARSDQKHSRRQWNGALGKRLYSLPKRVVLDAAGDDETVATAALTAVSAERTTDPSPKQSPAVSRNVSFLAESESSSVSDLTSIDWTDFKSDLRRTTSALFLDESLKSLTLRRVSEKEMEHEEDENILELLGFNEEESEDEESAPNAETEDPADAPSYAPSTNPTMKGNDFGTSGRRDSNSSLPTREISFFAEKFLQLSRSSRRELLGAMHSSEPEFKSNGTEQDDDAGQESGLSPVALQYFKELEEDQTLSSETKNRSNTHTVPKRKSTGTPQELNESEKTYLSAMESIRREFLILKSLIDCNLREDGGEQLPRRASVSSLTSSITSKRLSISSFSKNPGSRKSSYLDSTQLSYTTCGGLDENGLCIESTVSAVIDSKCTNYDVTDNNTVDCEAQLINMSAQDLQDNFRIKEADKEAYTATMLRFVYTLIAVLMAGFIFAFGFDLLLFLFLDLATELGVTSNATQNILSFVGILLSVPVFVYSLAFFMVVATKFVKDAFHGHPFLRMFGFGAVTTDWLAFVMYLGVPLTTIVITLCKKMEDWWAISLTVWFLSVLSFWVFFLVCLLWLWVDSSLDLVSRIDETLQENAWVARKIARSVFFTMNSCLSGTRATQYQIETSFEPNHRGNSTEEQIVGSSCASRAFEAITTSICLSCFYKELDPPRRIYTLDEASGSQTFATRSSWSLSKPLSSGSMSSSIPITFGLIGVTTQQINASIAYKLVTAAFTVLLLFGFAVWYGLENNTLAIFAGLLFIGFAFVAIKAFRLNALKRDMGEGRETLRFWRLHRMSEPKACFTWTVMFLQILLLYVLPLTYLCIKRSSPYVFAVLGVVSGIRYYINPSALLQEVGPMYFCQHAECSSKSDECKAKSRFYHIAQFGSESNAAKFWKIAYSFLVFLCIFVLMIAAKDVMDGSTTNPNYGYTKPSNLMVLTNDFEYPTQQNLLYPTCQLKDGSSTKHLDGSGVTDFAFLSGFMYVPDNEAQYQLDQWFGSGVAINDVSLLQGFQETFEGESYVTYRLVTFPDIENYAIISIRGTSTVWDFVADAQLWSTALLFQVLRAGLPFGSVFNPLIPKIDRWITALETERLKKVAFYGEIRELVHFLQNKGYTVQLTGHSLGGGLAFIAGAQTSSNAIGFSATNAVLSRETFDPPISIEQLNAYTSNIIPARDPIPMIDDRAQIFQEIACTAAGNNPISCHHITRTICELLYVCGSGGRPVPCECAQKFGYPEPNPIGSERNFTQSCRVARTAVDEATKTDFD